MGLRPLTECRLERWAGGRLQGNIQHRPNGPRGSAAGRSVRRQRAALRLRRLQLGAAGAWRTRALELFAYGLAAFAPGQLGLALAVKARFISVNS